MYSKTFIVQLSKKIKFEALVRKSMYLSGWESTKGVFFLKKLVSQKIFESTGFKKSVLKFTKFWIQKMLHIYFLQKKNKK